jgi:DNA replication protein DnaC
MNLVELQRALRQLRCSGMAAALEPRLLQAQAEKLAPIDFLSALVGDELLRRQDRLLDRRLKQAGFRDVGKTLDAFDFDFSRKLNRRLVFELATGRFVTQHEDGLFLGPPGTGKSHLAQAIGVAVIQQGHRVLYREAHTLVDELADAQLAGTRKATLAHLTTIPLLILDDLGMRKLPPTAAEDLLEIVMRRYERASTLITSNRPVEDWGKLLGETPPPSPHSSLGSSTTRTSSRAAHAAGARVSTASGRPPARDDVDDAARSARSATISAGAAPGVPLKNVSCSLPTRRATTHALGRRRLWPDLPRPRMAGFEVSTEVRATPLVP